MSGSPDFFNEESDDFAHVPTVDSNISWAMAPENDSSKVPDMTAADFQLGGQASDETGTLLFV